MDDQEPIRRWLAEKLRPRGKKAELAKVLQIDPSAITRMLQTGADKETRRIGAVELQKIEEFVGEPAPRPVMKVRYFDGLAHLMTKSSLKDKNLPDDLRESLRILFKYIARDSK